MKNFSLVASLLLTSTLAYASSHREAPAISMDPAADLTDVYVFPTAASKNVVAFIMNVSPAYQAFAGPTWYQFASDAKYDMNIDNNGDGAVDVAYRFEFSTNNYLAEEGLIVANFPSIEFKNGRFTGSLNQTYSVSKIDVATGVTTLIAKGLPVAPPRIGPATTDGGLANANDEKLMYEAYKRLSSNAIVSSGGYNFFAGPRNDPFYVDLGGVFDRVSVRIPGITGTPKDALAGSNVLSIAFEANVSEFSPKSRHFGVWASVSKPQATVRKPDGQPSEIGGGLIQVARLGNPLVNELVIKMKDKDKFNATKPKKDALNFAGYVLNPQLAFVLNTLYGPAGLTAPGFITKIDETNRTDLVAAFVDGLPGINRHPKAVLNAGEMLRINLDFPIQEWPLSGRQLNDDVVKSALVFLAQCKKLTGNTGSPANPFGKVDLPVSGVTPANCLLDDFVTADDKTPGGNGHLTTFPYLDLPFSAYGKQQ